MHLTGGKSDEELRLEQKERDVVRMLSKIRELRYEAEVERKEYQATRRAEAMGVSIRHREIYHQPSLGFHGSIMPGTKTNIDVWILGERIAKALSMKEIQQGARAWQTRYGNELSVM